MLIVMSGLPGVGKTAISRELARATGAVHLRIDTIEQAMRAAGWRVEGEGYAVGYALAADNLALGRTVIADCVNPWPLTRNAWRAVADRAGVRAIEIEVVCSDPVEHRRRVEQRQPDIDGHQPPTWQDVLDRDYRPWDGPRLVLDTARFGIVDCVQTITSRLSS